MGACGTPMAMEVDAPRHWQPETLKAPCSSRQEPDICIALARASTQFQRTEASQFVNPKGMEGYTSYSEGSGFLALKG